MGELLAVIKAANGATVIESTPTYVYAEFQREVPPRTPLFPQPSHQPHSPAKCTCFTPACLASMRHYMRLRWTV